MAFRRNRTSDKVKPAFGASTARARRDEDEPFDEIEQEKTPQKNEDKTRKRILARAVNLLAARARSEQQLRERLLEKQWAEPALVDQCIAQLKELGYLNDGLFARSYTISRVSAKPIGKSRLARELAGKKVARQAINEAIDEVFEEISEESLIDRAIEKRIRTHGRPENRNDSKRMFDYLMRLGFGYDLIRRKLQTLRAEIEENE